LEQNTIDRIRGLIDENDIVLFMKGEAEMPLCGFSAAVVQILNQIDVTFKAVNVLEDEDIRQGIKDFSDWPTIPQLYVHQEFIGGCDIVREMYMSGELADLLSATTKKEGTV
jgi:monothiol glutaredoxin